MDTIAGLHRTPMTVAQLVERTKQELDSDAAERQAKLLAASVGELPKESQTGATLDLSRQNISALPVEIIELIKDRVERLALSHNPSVILPSEIVQCEKIRYLNIRWNDLDHFPDVILRLNKLEILDLSKNNIEVIPDGIKSMVSLKFLAVARNKIRRLPLALGQMPSLQKLKFDENPIEFPPPDALSLPKKSGASSLESEREKEVCKVVKAYLKDVAAKQRVKLADEELSESSVETPRPPKRTATVGRFPIRPSISGIANGSDLKSSSPSDHFPPPIPQRSHARVASTTSAASLTPPTPQRPGVSPLRSNGGEVTRSRTDTASSLRQRRQGFVPKRGERKATGELNPLAEASNEAGDRLSQASTIKVAHSRSTSSVSTIGSFAMSSGGESSSSRGSPVEGVPARPNYPRTRTAIPVSSVKKGPSPFLQGVKRLILTLSQLQRVVEEIFTCLENAPASDLSLRTVFAKACSSVICVDDILRNASNGSAVPEDKFVLRRSLQALEAYVAVASALKRNLKAAVTVPDGFHVRSLMLQIFATIAECRNICSILGFAIQERSAKRDTLRPSKAWSSRTVTPTQHRVPSERRQRRPTVLQTATNGTTLRAMGPPGMSIHTNGSRSATMPSISVATPRSSEALQSLSSERPNVSRTNTMRSMVGVPEPDEQFEHIFLKVRNACKQTSQTLSALRIDFVSRRDHAISMSQPRPAYLWVSALNKCEVVSTHNQALKNRLEMVKVNDPNVRYQRDFWQLCDSFVHSWIDLATEVKDLGAQRVDVTSVKQIMRNAQKLVKEVSKTISHSPLYHHALGTRMPDIQPPSLAPPFTPSTTSSYSSGGPHQNPYITAGPATPLSAALGPAAHTVASSSGSGSASQHASQHMQREYYQEPLTSRSSHERNDTVIQAPPRQKSRRQLERSQTER